MFMVFNTEDAECNLVSYNMSFYAQQESENECIKNNIKFRLVFSGILL